MFRITLPDQQWLDLALSSHDGKLDYRYHTSDNRIPYMPALKDTAHLCDLLKRHGDASLPDAIRQIAKNDWCLAAAVAIETNLALPSVNHTADAITPVSLTVLAGNDDIFLEQAIPMSTWLHILSGRSWYIADGYSYEGEHFNNAWHFDDGELTLDGEDGMRLFNDKVDNIWRINGWQFGPKNLPTLLLKRQNELRTLQSEREKAAAEEALKKADYADFLARIDTILKNDRKRRSVENTFTWREALELYEEKLGNTAPIWVQPLAPAHVLFPSIAIRILVTAVKAEKALPMSFYIPDCAFVPDEDLKKGYIASFEALQAKLRLSPSMVTLEDLPENTTESDLPGVSTKGLSAWPLDPLMNANGVIEAYWLPPVKLDRQSTQLTFVDAFRRGDREVLSGLDPDGLLCFDRSDRPWFKTSYGKAFLAAHAVPLATLNAKLTARLKAESDNRDAVLHVRDEILAIYNQDRENAARSEVPYPSFELDSVWLELNAIDRNRPDDADFWSFRLPEGPVINAGDTFGDRYCAATIDDYAINVCNELRTAVAAFKRLSIAAEALPVGLPFDTLHDFLTSLGIDFEPFSIRHAYTSQHRCVGWIEQSKRKALKKAADKAIRECKEAFNEVDRSDLLKRIGSLTAEVARLSGRQTRTDIQNKKRIVPNSERALTRLLSLSNCENTAIEPFIVGPFISDGLHVVVATEVSGVPIPDGLYRALLDRINEAIPVKLDRVIGSDRHLEIPKSRDDWDRCWLTTPGSAVTPDFRVRLDIDLDADLIRQIVSRALNDEAHGKFRFIVR